MRAYRAILSARFRTLLQYRAAAVAGIITQVFFGFVIVMVYTAFYASSSGPKPMTLAQVVTYVWLGQAMFRITLLRGDAEVTQLVRTGGVAYELLRPVDLYGLWFSRNLAGLAAPISLRAIPMLIIAKLLLGMAWPASAASGLAWAAASAGALLLACSMSTMLTISLMWTVSGEGAWRIAPTMAWLLCGINVPLPLFPDWAQGVIAVLPFRGILDTPLRIYMGHITAEQAPFAIAHQLAWTAAFVIVGRWLLSRGKRRLVVQGG
jgi:ABC-2 type transport system permease protein